MSERNPSLAIGVSAVVIFLFGSLGGANAVKNYLRTKWASEKLVSIRYHGEWSVGEYRDCFSYNWPEAEDKPEILCSDQGDSPKMFKTKLIGQPTYDREAANNKVIEWFWVCRKQNDDVTFSCVKKEIPAKQGS